MSDINIPFEIQTEIIKKLPVKSLIQFRTVSKTWKSLIDSSTFIARHMRQHTHAQHLLVSYNYLSGKDNVTKHVSIVNDDIFPQQKISLTVPGSFLKYYRIIGSSNGLMCLYGGVKEGNYGRAAVLWNPSIRKAVNVIVPNVEDGMYETKLGFGVCRKTNDPKIVKIRYIFMWDKVESVTCIPWQVEVFTLSTGAWRCPFSNLPRKSIQFVFFQVDIDGVLYWLATDRSIVDCGFRSYRLIISFDMTTEEFKEVNLPDSLAHPSHIGLSIYKLRESLVVLECSRGKNLVYNVWMMDDGATKSFTKLFAVETPLNTLVIGLWKSVAPIVEISEDRRVLLDVYEPYLQCINIIGIDRMLGMFSVYPYMETLLLLDQPNLIVYNDI